MCSHQLTRPAVVVSSNRNPRRNVIISVAMNNAMTTDSIDTVVPSPTGRTIVRRIRRYAMPLRTIVLPLSAAATPAGSPVTLRLL